MKNNQVRAQALPVLIGLAAGAVSVQGGMDLWGEEPNRLGFAIRPAFNIKASFSDLGGAPAQTDVGPAVGGVNHYYDDGYNLVDSSGNGEGTTWYWGYSKNSQVGEGYVDMSSSYAAPAGSLSEVTNDPHWGGELTYMREIGWNNSYWYGVVVGLGWHHLRFAQDSNFAYAAQRLTDRYSSQLIAAEDMPPAPYAGGFDDVAGPQLSDTPERSVTTLPGEAFTRGSYDYEAEAYALRVGLLFETPFSDGFDLQFGGGVVGTMVDGRFSFRERTVVSNLSDYEVAGEEKEAAFAGGGYGEINLSLRVSKGIYAFVGAQYLILSDITHSVGGRTVQLDLKNGILASAGMTFAF
ncbi:MAG: hypothetical protein ACO34E_14455 [Limisphaerales bacterium]